MKLKYIVLGNDHIACTEVSFNILYLNWVTICNLSRTLDL